MKSEIPELPPKPQRRNLTPRQRWLNLIWGLLLGLVFTALSIGLDSGIDPAYVAGAALLGAVALTVYICLKLD